MFVALPGLPVASVLIGQDDEHILGRFVMDRVSACTSVFGIDSSGYGAIECLIGVLP